MRFAAAVLATLLTQGCASDRPYVEPTGSDVARLSGKFIRESHTDWERYALRGIDGLETPRSMWQDAADVTVAVTPGPHRVAVKFEYNRTRRAQLLRGPSEPTEAYYILQARFERGREYQVNGQVSAQFTEVWIEEKQTGQVASLRVRCVPRSKNANAPAICSKPVGEAASSQSNEP